MINQFKLPSNDAVALRENDETLLAQLRYQIRAWIFGEANARTAAWQIRGLPIHLDQLGPTPLSASELKSGEAACMEKMVAWIASCLGKCVTFPGMKQSGQNVQQVFPVSGFENRQSAASSLTPLEWHTEHADKDRPPDFLVIACLRNQDRIGTRLSRPDLSHLGHLDKKTLSTPAEFQFKTRSELSEELAVIDHEGLRYDPIYCVPKTELSWSAFQQLKLEVERKALVSPQEPAAALIIPNRQTVHAREHFQARYDGTDRWLMRAMVHK